MKEENFDSFIYQLSFYCEDEYTEQTIRKHIKLPIYENFSFNTLKNEFYIIMMKESYKKTFDFVTINTDSFDSFENTFNFQIFQTNNIFRNEQALLTLRENAGGSSNISEALSIQILADFFSGSNFITENEIQYDFINISIVDFIVEFAGLEEDTRMGVSVCRALKFKDPMGFNEEDAYILLKKKLKGLQVAKQGVSKGHQYFRTLLFCWCQNQHISDMLTGQLAKVQNELELEQDIIFWFVVSDWEAIYENEYQQGFSGQSISNI